MGRAPGLHFLWILMDLGTQLRANLGGKSEPRQEKTGQDRYERVLKKRCEKRPRLDLVLGGGWTKSGLGHFEPALIRGRPGFRRGDS